MENNLENKAKFFAQYWGQAILMNNHLTLSSKHFISPDFDKYWIELKPLSLITEEDAIEVAQILGDAQNGASVQFLCGNDGFDFTGDLCGTFWFDAEINYNNEEDSNSLRVLSAYELLKSKGYALPYLGVSIKKLIKFGWIKLIEKC